MMAHTKGPWKEHTDANGDHWILAGDEKPDGMHSYLVGNLEDTCAECHANARLIAAAPDLLEACETAYNELVSVDRETGIVAQEVFGELSAAIAKARGGE